MASGASAPPYSISNASQMGVPIGPPIGPPPGEMRMPLQSPYPTQLPPPYGNATTNVTPAADSSTAQPQVVYVISKNNSESNDFQTYSSAYSTYGISKSYFGPTSAPNKCFDCDYFRPQLPHRSEASAPPSTIKNQSLIGVPIGPPICPPNNFLFGFLTRLPTPSDKVFGIHKSGEMASSSPSAPPYTIPNPSQTGVPFGSPIGGTAGGMPMQQPPPYVAQPPQQPSYPQLQQSYPHPMQPPQPYPYTVQAPTSVNHSTVNVHQETAPAENTIYVIKKKTGGCCAFVLLIIILTIIGIVYGVRASR